MGRFAAVHEQIAFAKLRPVVMMRDKEVFARHDFRLDTFLFNDSLKSLTLNYGSDQKLRDDTIQLVDEIFDVLCYFNTAFQPSTCNVSTTYADLTDETYAENVVELHPFQNCLGFATYFGYRDYVAQYMIGNIRSS